MEVSEQEHLQINRLKLSHFLQQNTNPKPDLPSATPIRQLLREYLNDDDFTILREGNQVFKDDSYEQFLQATYLKWRSGGTKPSDIDDFIYYWIDHPDLSISYSLYDDIEVENAGISHFSLRSKPPIHELDEAKDEITSTLNGETSFSCSRQPMKLEDDSLRLILLKHFFSHFCKKEVSNISSSTFDKYQQYYQEMNLTKWMVYVRDIGLGQFQKIIPLRKFKAIFLKYQNSDQCLTFDTFQKALSTVLTTLYPHDSAQGYELLGIFSSDNFKHKYQQLGLFPPTINLKPPNSRKMLGVSSLSKIRRDFVATSKISIVSFDDRPQRKVSVKFKNVQKENSKMVTEGQLSGEIRSSIHQNLPSSEVGKSTNQLTSRRHLKMRLNQQIFKDMIKEEESDDPYLKRYNHKENLNYYHSVIQRIDQRVEKMCEKY